MAGVEGWAQIILKVFMKAAWLLIKFIQAIASLFKKKS